MPRYSVDQQPLVDNLGYRLRDYYRSASIQIGAGNANGEILVIQSHTKIPERDATTGALKRFGMLGDAYRATSMIIEQNHASPKPIKVWQDKINRYYLKELIAIVRPSLVVACGSDVLSMLKERQIRAFSSYTGKIFKVADIKHCMFFATLDPASYGFARAPVELKAQGKEEWTSIAALYRDLKQKLAKERWE